MRISIRASLALTILIIVTFVDFWRYWRLWTLETHNNLLKRDALQYSSCKDPTTVRVRYGGHHYECEEIANDVHLGPFIVALERWLYEAWWYPERPYRHLADNPWALTAIACVAVGVFIMSIIWMWSSERSEQRIMDQHERDQQRMERQHNRLLEATTHSASSPQLSQLLDMAVVTPRSQGHMKWRRSSMPEMYIINGSPVPAHVVDALQGEGSLGRSYGSARETRNRSYVRGNIRSNRRY